MDKKISYDQLVMNFRDWKNSFTEQHILFCAEQKTLEEAIKVAATAVNSQGKTHSHQWRVGATKLGQLAKCLVEHQKSIALAGDFEELIAIIEQAKPYGIGELTVYDTAIRIGAFLGITPQRVYLHAGTRKGVKNLLGITGRKSIELSELPTALAKHQLTAMELEDLFCHFKDFSSEAPLAISHGNSSRC